MNAEAPRCKHGYRDYCVHCEAEAAPRCEHGNPYYCGFCGSVGSGYVKNAVTCGICQAPADKTPSCYQCQANPNHVGDLTVGIFTDHNEWGVCDDGLIRWR
jgi:hypothetical protein